MRKRLANTLSTVKVKTRERADHRSFPIREVALH